MKRVLVCIFFFLAIYGIAFGDVYDCFLFFNELDILTIRLHEMAPHVDQFVLVESVETFRGNPKPLYYLENKERYKEFENKIIHVILDERTNHVSPWDRETFQRNQIMRGLKSAKPDDTIFISDLDEIVRREKILDIVKEIRQDSIGKCEQTMYSFHFNILCPHPWPWGTVVMGYNWLKNKTPQQAREISKASASHLFDQAGWHFSWMGGIKINVEKLEAFSHAELDLPKNKTAAAMKRGLGLHEWQPVEINRSFPHYVVDHLDYFREAGFILSELEIQELIHRGVIRR